MGNFWFKVKLWTKSIVFGLIGLYVIVFISSNWGVTVNGDLNLVFIHRYPSPPILGVLFFTSVLSIVGWWLFRTVLKTVRQFREMRQRNRTTRLEKEVAEMKAKAGMLQSKESAAAETPTASTQGTEKA